MRNLGLAALLMIPLAQDAAAQAPIADGDIVRALASNYELADASGERRCAIFLESKTAAPGYAINFDRANCTPLFGYLAEVTAWRPAPAGAIYFVNAKNGIVAEFTEGVGGVYEAIRERDGVYFLANLQFADPSREIQLKDVAGDWNLARPNGAPLCRITLSDELAGEERFAVRVAPKCDTAIMQFGPVTWNLDRGDIILFSQKDERLRFGRNEDGVWAKVPDRPRPLLLVKP